VTTPVTRDDIRIGDAERDAVAVALHDHFAAGRLSWEELDERLDATLAAKTRGDLRGTVRDLPEPTGLPRPPEPARRHGRPWGHHRPAWGHRPHFPMFPLLLGVFLVTAFTLGTAAGLAVVLQLALLVWIARSVVLLVMLRRARRTDKGT
jgi:hypothetical protein